MLLERFHKGMCINTTYPFQNTDGVIQNAKNIRNTMHAFITSKPKPYEKTRMLKLKTVYFYGLSDQLRYEYKTDDTHILVVNKFLALSRKRTVFLWYFSR